MVPPRRLSEAPLAKLLESRHRPQLSQDPKEIKVAPLLDDFPVLDAKDLDAAGFDLPARRRNSGVDAGLGTFDSPAGDNLVAIGDMVFPPFKT